MFREPSNMINRQNRWSRTINQPKSSSTVSLELGHGVLRCAVAIAIMACLLSAPQCVCAQAEAEAASPDATLALLHRRDYAAAMRQVEALQRVSPDDRFTVTLTGMLMLSHGDAHNAVALFANASSHSPEESLYSYGLGVSELAGGDLASAEHALTVSLKCGGDSEDIRVARRYIRFLKGNIAPEQGARSPADAALDGMAAIRSGRQHDALGLLQSAVNGEIGAGGDPFLQSDGPLMSFDASKPITADAPPIKGAASARALETGTGGDLLLSPEETPRGTRYAAYSLDGEALSIVGTRPYTYTWDTRRVSNGRHIIVITLYDGAGGEIGRSERSVRVFNPTAARANSDGDRDRDRELVGQFWRALKLKPDRCACDYALGTAYRALSDRASERIWFSRAAAICPAYRDTWACLQACGGVGGTGATLYSGRTDEKCVALTFDDGPKPGVTEPLLELLVSAHVPATFFVIGRHVQEYPELAKSISSAGMEIANHSYTHRSLTALSDDDAVQEMLQTQAVVLAVTGTLPRYLRPPGGNWNNKVAAEARKWGITPCMWSVDVFDSEIIGARKVAEAVLTQVKPGSIILMHNGKVSTLQALPTILRELKARGYTFVTVDALAHRAAGAISKSGGSSADLHRVHAE